MVMGCITEYHHISGESTQIRLILMFQKLKFRKFCDKNILFCPLQAANILVQNSADQVVL